MVFQVLNIQKRHKKPQDLILEVKNIESRDPYPFVLSAVLSLTNWRRKKVSVLVSHAFSVFSARPVLRVFFWFEIIYLPSFLPMNPSQYLFIC
jgi:hypothetical protein